ncbi:F-box/kelch-repeat protein At1g57790-like [Papaver somniferum]|uniref:F-box/kelch-repeat protein At1g57790-like n=1 Tax=Papaver somniferum TaxID=3469 RepID=UPI000E6F81DF|nr:F-box/kelch-repeat protein At1g57790-like [Papaver somniferum]
MEDWVESGNEIFKVVLNCSPRGFRKVASTHIFKLDFSSMTWVLLKTLGDRVLFLCTNMDTSRSRKCYSTSSAYCSATDMGLERGCLFYTLSEDQTLYVYEVEDNATTVIMPCLKLPTPWFLPTWIMMPTTVNRHVARRRRRITNLLVNQDTTSTSTVEDNMTGTNNSGGELEASKQWDFVDDYDSLEEIARFLHPVDYIHFRLACKQNSIFLPALNRILAATRTSATTYLSPWLISIFEDDEDTICDVLDPMHDNDKYLMKLSDQLLVGSTIRFSKDGWLLLSNGKKKVFCYNPFTKAMIFLPDFPDNYVLGGMSFSWVPTSQDCLVVVISNWCPMGGDNEISFLVTEPGNSAIGWNIHRFDYEGFSEEGIAPYMVNFMPCINNPVFYHGAFYCLDYNGILGIFSVKDTYSWKVLPRSLKQFGSFYPSYLVECDDKLLLVNVGLRGKSVDIYRLDDSEMVWVKLNSLGKHALFISYASSFSAIAPRSFMVNNIYFPRLQGERILYHSLDTCRYHFVGGNQHYAQDFHNTKERSNCTWIEPRWS